MNFNAACILWGEITENNVIRDLGIYMFSAETIGA